MSPATQFLLAPTKLAAHKKTELPVRFFCAQNLFSYRNALRRQVPTSRANLTTLKLQLDLRSWQLGFWLPTFHLRVRQTLCMFANLHATERESLAE